MTRPPAAAFFAALDATWPARSEQSVDGWIIRDGAGGGKRASATICAKDGTNPDPARAEACMTALGQPLLFQLRPGQEALDQALATRGYRKCDPTLIYAAPIAQIARAAPPVSLFPNWPGLAIMRDIWSDAGMSAARLEVMKRASQPCSGFLARHDDRVAGVAFCAIRDGIAMMHAMEILPRFRRMGVAEMMLRGCADWAQTQQAKFMALAVTEDNSNARALYDKIGLTIVTRYHYRQKQENT